MNQQKGLAPILIVILMALAIGGYLIYQKQFKSVPQQVTQSSPSPITTSTATNSAETVYTESTRSANWKTYTDKDRLIQFNYPNDAKVTSGKAYSMLSSEVADSITIEKPYVNIDNSGYIIDIVVRDNPQGISVKTVINNYLSEVEKYCSPSGCALTEQVRSTLKVYSNKAISGYTFKDGGPENDYVMVVQVKRNKTYLFRSFNATGFVTEEGTKIFDQILSTFKFIQ